MFPDRRSYLGLNAASGKKGAAYEFIRFMTAPEQQKFRAIEGSFLPTLAASTRTARS